MLNPPMTINIHMNTFIHQGSKSLLLTNLAFSGSTSSNKFSVFITVIYKKSGGFTSPPPPEVRGISGHQKKRGPTLLPGYHNFLYDTATIRLDRFQQIGAR